LSVYVHYCDKCGIRIEPEDVKEGRAVLQDDGQAFCPKCAPKAKDPAKSETGEKPEVKKPPLQRKRTTQIRPVKRKTTTSISRRTRREKVDEYEEDDEESARPSYGAKKKSPLPIILGVGGVIVVIIIIAIATSGSDDKPVRDKGRDGYATNDRSDGPPPPPEYEGAGRKTPVRDDGPRGSQALKKYQEVLEFARINPDNYADIVDKLETVSRSSNIDPELMSRIQISTSEWMGKWDNATRNDWDETSKRADRLVESEEYANAAKLWDDFAVKHERHTAYQEQALAEAKRLRLVATVLEEMKALDGDIKAAERGFTVDQLAKAREVHDKICEFGRKYKELDIVVKKLGPIVIKLREDIDKLEDEEWARELEGLGR